MSDSEKTQEVAPAPTLETSPLLNDLAAASSAPLDTSSNDLASSLQDPSRIAASPDLSQHMDSMSGHGEHEDLSELASFLESREKYPALPEVSTPHEFSPGAAFQGADIPPTTPRDSPSLSPAPKQQSPIGDAFPKGPTRDSRPPSASGEMRSLSPSPQHSERAASNASDTQPISILNTTALPESPPIPTEIPTPSPVSHAATPTPPKREGRSRESEDDLAPESPSIGREGNLGHVAPIAGPSEGGVELKVEVEVEVEAEAEPEAKLEATEQDPTAPDPITSDDAKISPAVQVPIVPDDTELSSAPVRPDDAEPTPATPTTMVPYHDTEQASSISNNSITADAEHVPASPVPIITDDTEQTPATLAHAAPHDTDQAAIEADSGTLVEKSPVPPAPITPEDAELAFVTPVPITSEITEVAPIQSTPITPEDAEQALIQPDLADDDRDGSSAEPVRDDSAVADLERVDEVLPPFTPYSPPLSPLSNEADESLNGDLAGDIDALSSSDTFGPGGDVDESRAKSPENGVLSDSLIEPKIEPGTLLETNDGQVEELPGSAEAQEGEEPPAIDVQEREASGIVEANEEGGGATAADGMDVEPRSPESALGIAVSHTRGIPRTRGRARKSTRGRPRKLITAESRFVESLPAVSASGTSMPHSSGTPRKRGRPRKIVESIPPPKPIQLGFVSGAPRKRGRPRKTVEPALEFNQLGKRRTPTVEITTRRWSIGSKLATPFSPADFASPSISYASDPELIETLPKGSSGITKDAPNGSYPDTAGVGMSHFAERITNDATLEGSNDDVQQDYENLSPSVPDVVEGDVDEPLFSPNDLFGASHNTSEDRHAETPLKTTVKTEESNVFEIVGASSNQENLSSRFQNTSFEALKESTSQEFLPKATPSSSYDPQVAGSSDTASDTESESESESEEEVITVPRKRRFALGGLWRGRSAREAASLDKRRRAVGHEGIFTRRRSREANGYDDSTNEREAARRADASESGKSSREEELDAAAEQELAALTPEDIAKLCDRTHRGRKSRILNLLLQKGRITLSDIFRRCDVPTVAPTTENWRHIAPRAMPPRENDMASSSLLRQTEIEWSEDEYFSGESSHRRSLADALHSSSVSLSDHSDHSGVQKPLPPPEQLKNPGFVFEMSPLPVPRSISYMAFRRKYRTWSKRKGSRTVPGMPKSPVKSKIAKRFLSRDTTSKQPVVMVALGRSRFFSRHRQNGRQQDNSTSRSRPQPMSHTRARKTTRRTSGF